MLHTINQPPIASAALLECLRVCVAGDVILLIEDGVYAGLKDSGWVAQLFDKVDKVYALEADARARGLSGRLSAQIEAIDYTGFVELCSEQSKMTAWY